MVTNRRRPRGREITRPNAGGPAAEHKMTIGASVVTVLVLIVVLLTLTSIGHTIDLAVQHFMLFYGGVFALIGLCLSVVTGLVSTDRMFLHPGRRVMMQSVHRAASFGAFTFLVIHVVTEILAQRIDVIDAFIPFLQPFKTFYVGLGTISSDIIVLLVITGILRKRFVTNGKGTWRWRAIHYANYVAFVFGVWHGLLGGRPAKPYVDWSYGFVVAFVALGIAVRVLSSSLRPKEGLSAPPVAESATSGTAPLRAAMLARASSVRMPLTQALPGGQGHGGQGQGGPRASLGHGETMAQELPVHEPGYEGPPRYQGAPRPAASGPVQAVPNSTISGPLPEVSQMRRGGGYPAPPSGPLPQVPGGPSGAYGRPPAAPTRSAGYSEAGYPEAGYPQAGCPEAGYPRAGYPARPPEAGPMAGSGGPERDPRGDPGAPYRGFERATRPPLRGRRR